MRILLFTSAYHPHKGGVEEVVRQLALSYRRHGHQVLVVAPRWPRNLPITETIDGQTVRRVSMPLPSTNPRSLASFLRRFGPSTVRTLHIGLRWKPDVVHVQCVGPNGLYAWLLSTFLSTPLVVTSQGEQTMDASAVYDRSAIQRWVLRRLLLRADAVTACSADALHNLKRFGIWQCEAQVIPNAVNPDEAALALAERPHQRSYVFALGRHVWNKGFYVLLQAFSLLASEHTQLDLVIAGDGPEHANLYRRSDELGLNGRVIFPGFIERAAVATYFRHCAFFVLPSFREPFGIVALEAMLAGKAVIATMAGGVPEFVKEGQNGLLVSAGDVPALAAAMDALVSNPALAKRLGKSGEDLVRSEFTWQQIHARYLDVYAQVSARCTSRAHIRTGTNDP